MLLFDINVNGLLNEKDRNQRDKQNFLALGDLVRSSNKVFIEQLVSGRLVSSPAAEIDDRMVER